MINRYGVYQILKENDIISNEEVDFLQDMHDAFCYSCGG
jgi:hypothetical protein